MTLHFVHFVHVHCILYMYIHVQYYTFYENTGFQKADLLYSGYGNKCLDGLIM